MTNFNSIKVQLKRSQYFRHKKGHDKFQFHKGTIKANMGSAFWGLFPEFQFHKGTIKAYVFCFYHGATVRDFNSIKVQLKQAL